MKLKGKPLEIWVHIWVRLERVPWMLVLFTALALAAGFFIGQATTFEICP